MESCIDSSKMIWNIIPVDLDGMNESMNTFNTKNENRANVCLLYTSPVEGFGRAATVKNIYKKPIIFDEVCYEGNMDNR